MSVCGAAVRFGLLLSLAACSAPAAGGARDAGGPPSSSSPAASSSSSSSGATSSVGGSSSSALSASASASSSSGAACSACRWEARASLPKALQETAVVAWHGQVWVLGGFDGDLQPVADVWVYNPQTDAWIAGPLLPRAVHHLNAAVVADRLHVLGGLEGFAFAVMPEIWVLESPQSDRWQLLGTMDPARARGAAAVGVVGSRVVLAGGLRTQSVALADMYDVVGGQWTTLPSLPVARDHSAGAAVGTVMVVTGGRHGQLDGQTDLMDVSVPNPSWMPGPAMPVPRAGVLAAAWNGFVVVMGGEGNPNAGHGLFANVEAYEVATRIWHTWPDMDPPRHGSGAAAVGNAIHVPGGATQMGFGAVPTHQVLVPQPTP